MKTFLLIGAFAAVVLFILVGIPGTAWADHIGGRAFAGPGHFGGHWGSWGFGHRPGFGFSLGLVDPYYPYPYWTTPYGYYYPYPPRNVYPYGFNFYYGR